MYLCVYSACQPVFRPPLLVEVAARKYRPRHQLGTRPGLRGEQLPSQEFQREADRAISR